MHVFIIKGDRWGSFGYTLSYQLKYGVSDG